MFQANKFELVDGEPVDEQVEEWVETFFMNLMNTMNAFFSRVSLEESIGSLRGIDFADLVLEQLENQPDNVRALAAARISELAETEISMMEAYMNKD